MCELVPRKGKPPSSVSQSVRLSVEPVILDSALGTRQDALAVSGRMHKEPGHTLECTNVQ